MPVKKTEQFSPFENQIAIVGRALAHPARIKIIQLAHQHGTCRNVDLIKQLELSKTSVHNHIQKLVDANLIQIHFHPNHYLISNTKNGLFQMNYFTNEFN